MARSAILGLFLIALPTLAVIDPAGRWEARRGTRDERPRSAPAALPASDFAEGQPAEEALPGEWATAWAEPRLHVTSPPLQGMGGEAGARPQASFPSHRPTAPPPAADELSTTLPDAAQAIHQRLVELGALYMRLEEGEGAGSQQSLRRYYFTCQIADPSGQEEGEWFRGEGHDPASAMRQALFDVNRWQIARQALLPDRQSSQY